MATKQVIFEENRIKYTYVSFNELSEQHQNNVLHNLFLREPKLFKDQKFLKETFLPSYRVKVEVESGKPYFHQLAPKNYSEEEKKAMLDKFRDKFIEVYKEEFDELKSLDEESEEYNLKMECLMYDFLADLHVEGLDGIMNDSAIEVIQEENPKPGYTSLIAYPAKVVNLLGDRYKW